MRGPVLIDGWLNTSLAVKLLSTMFPIGELCMNDYTPPSIVMGVSSDFFRL